MCGGIFNEKATDWYRHYISSNYCILPDSTYNWMDIEFLLWGHTYEKISTFLLKAFILILFCVITFFITRYLYIPKGQKIEKTDSAIGKTIELSGETIRSNIANIGKLATAEYTYTHVEHFDSSRTIGDFKIPLTKTSYIFSYDGTIIAGVDFTKTNVNKNDTSKTITITLPEVEIISSDVDQDSFQLYDEKRTFLTLLI